MFPLLRFFSMVLLLAMAYVPAAYSASTDTADNNWQVISLQGEVAYKQGGATDWQPLLQQQTITGPFYLKTGAASRVVFSHREDTVSVASNSIVRIDAEEATEEGFLTRLYQSVGYSLFKIKKNSGRQVEVETPYLVSVVKGTTFTVQSDSQRAVVNLIEGRLLVKQARAKAQRFITSGQIAQFARGDTGISVVDTTGNVVSPTASTGVPAVADSADSGSQEVATANNGKGTGGNGRGNNFVAITSVINDGLRPGRGFVRNDVPTAPGPGNNNTSSNTTPPPGNNQTAGNTSAPTGGNSGNTSAPTGGNAGAGNNNTASANQGNNGWGDGWWNNWGHPWYDGWWNNWGNGNNGNGNGHGWGNGNGNGHGWGNGGNN